MLDEFAFFIKKADYLVNTDFYWMIILRPFYLNSDNANTKNNKLYKNCQSICINNIIPGLLTITGNPNIFFN